MLNDTVKYKIFDSKINKYKTHILKGMNKVANKHQILKKITKFLGDR